jgi:DNA-binding CsgD family transcriptional regulator
MVDLTNREIDVIKLVVDGNTNSEIAEKLCISIHTVKSILENIYLKTDLHNRVQVAVWAFKNLFSGTDKIVEAEDNKTENAGTFSVR